MPNIKVTSFKKGHIPWNKGKKGVQISTRNCSGRIEAHHILGWSDYPELRYEINNGITLCHAHHPKRRAEEKRLIPKLQELVSVSIGNICQI